MKENPNFVNVYGLIVLMIVGLGTVAWFVIRGFNNFKTNGLTTTYSSVEEFSNHYKFPLPYGVDTTNANETYLVDNMYVRDYITTYVNAGIKDQSIVDYDEVTNGYSLPITFIDELAVEYFDKSSTTLGFDNTDNSVIIPQRLFIERNFNLEDVKQKGSIYYLTYEETSSAYYNGDINEDALEVTSGRYTFKVLRLNDKYYVKSYQYKVINDVPDDYQIVTG